MDSQFPNLLSPAKIKNTEIRNRIITAPLWTNYGTSEGSVTPRHIAYYAEKAKGGSGLVTIEYTYIDQIGSKSASNQLGIYSDEKIPGFALLGRAIHDWGAKCSVQLCHAGAMKFIPEPPFLGPSDGFHDKSTMGPVPPTPVKGLSLKEIKGIIKAFGEAARRVKLAGFDMVDLHAAHGYLIGQFLSAFFNKRTDEYGGTLENRMRFPLEVVRAMRKAVGDEFPIVVRMNGTDYEPELPITLEEAIEFAKRLEEAGADALHVSGGSDVIVHKVVISGYQKFGFNVYLAEAVKKKSGIKIPVIATGAITTPQLAEEILREGKADFIALGRPSLADPYWGRKLKESRPEEIIPCIRCNTGCVGRGHTSYWGASCAVNPLTGYEGIRRIAPLKEKKKVAVIGGGPGGMEAARVSCIRGHDVTLYEKRELGGALIEASWDAELKQDIRLLLDYFRNQMKKLKIHIVSEEATVDTITKGGYDAVIVANGALPRKLDIPGIDKPQVYDAIDVTRGKEKDLGQKVIVLGGGVLASEIALSQAMKGKSVIMAAPEGCHMGEYEVAGDAALPTRVAMLELLKENGVDINLCLLPKTITENGVVCVDKEGRDKEFRGDSVVVCRGFLPDKRLTQALMGKIPEVRPIGDCVEARIISDAILEGWLAGNQV